MPRPDSDLRGERRTDRADAVPLIGRPDEPAPDNSRRPHRRRARRRGTLT